jgi:hypothetical protein
MTKHNLIIVRAGSSSLHPSWLLPVEERNWDIVVNYYGDDPKQFRGKDIERIDSKGPKWPSLHALLMSNAFPWRSYDFVWFPDDDLACSGHQINRFFDICRDFKIDLAQPSLSWESHISHLITVHNPNFRIRFTNFVEIMAPCFSRRLLGRGVGSFSVNLSGWGLDFIWPRWVAGMNGVCAIIDDVQITHTRPVGGPNYVLLDKVGISPQKELNETLKKHRVGDMRQINLEGISVKSEKWSLMSERGNDYINFLCSGWREYCGEKTEDLENLMREHRDYRERKSRIHRIVRSSVARMKEQSLSNRFLWRWLFL